MPTLPRRNRGLGAGHPRALPDVGDVPPRGRPRRVPVTLHLYRRRRPSTIVRHELPGEAAAVLQAGPVLVDVLEKVGILLNLSQNF